VAEAGGGKLNPDVLEQGDGDDAVSKHQAAEGTRQAYARVRSAIEDIEALVDQGEAVAEALVAAIGDEVIDRLGARSGRGAQGA